MHGSSPSTAIRSRCTICRKHASIGGPDMLNGISVYFSTRGDIPHLHFVTYGFSSLFYDEAAFGQEFSRFGFELTFRLKAPASKKKKHGWVPTMLQNLARYVFKSNTWFEEYHFINTKGAFQPGSATHLTGLAVVASAMRSGSIFGDPELGAMETVHGKVQFLQLVGLTGVEFDSLVTNEGEGVPVLLDALRVGNPMLVTDLGRT